MPWVRLHGVKDYLDMVKILEKYPKVHQTFNLVPSLVEQLEDYGKRNIKDKFLELSYKRACELSKPEQDFLLENFFKINISTVIAIFPRYYELYFKHLAKKEFSTQDFLDLQVWFNLAWLDPSFRQTAELDNLVKKARYFSEEEKCLVLDKQAEILEDVIPIYKQFSERGQIELTTNPYYHPILPLLYSTNLAREANPKTRLPKITFAYPQDCQAQIEGAVDFHKQRFGAAPEGMWPSEESVCEHILTYIIQAGIKWIVTDEAILFKSLKSKKRDPHLLYQSYLLKRKEGDLNIVFRDRNLSDLIGFVYYSWKAKDAADDFIRHLKNISDAFKGKDILVTIAMDGENAWEYYPNDGHDFLDSLYQRLSESEFVRMVTISEYLRLQPAKPEIKRLAAGSWIYANFGKWMDNPYKAKAWDYLAQARKELQDLVEQGVSIDPLAWKQMYIAEGSDWFWWYGEDHGDFDRLFRMHLSNFYTLIRKDPPEYLKKPLTP